MLPVTACVRAAPTTPASRATFTVSVHPVALGGLRPIERGLGARIRPFEACSGFTRVAARTLADPPKAGLCPRGFDGSVALAVSRVATKVYRHLLGPDFHRLR